MSRRCTVCVHAKRDTIDAALVDRKLSYRAIASKFGLTSSAVHRHAQKHLPETLAKAHGIGETASADKLLHRVESLIDESEQLLDYGRKKKKFQAWQGGLQELHKNTVLLAKVTGELNEQPQINIVTNPQWIGLRTDLIQILGDFPEVKKRVLEAFNAHSNPTD